MLAIDRALDTQAVVLLHALAGSGKTSAAAEFARWYANTGGVSGQVIFTSFEHYTPLTQVLEVAGNSITPQLRQNGILWQTLTQEQKQQLVLQLLRQISLLWIWDNVESVTGFPAGTQSDWTQAEQEELVTFLRKASNTRAKFLLTSRRDEGPWLGNLPVRIMLQPMPMLERLQLAQALSEKHGRRPGDVEDWRPLLRFSQGNPLALTVMVGQCLHEGMRTRREVEDFVDKLRIGEAAFRDEATEGRSRSLAASLSYGFQHAFTGEERKVLALLYLFQGFVNIETLGCMGHPLLGSLSELPALKEHETVVAILNRAAEIGLLTSRGGGCYSIHPALPRFFADMFRRYYPDSMSGTSEGSDGMRVRRAFCAAFGNMANLYHRRY